MTKGTIAIIGGGIGGIAAGIALLQSGFAVRVFERTDQLREAGAGIVLWPNATGILHEFGALDAVLKQGQLSTNFLVRSFQGEVLMNISTAAADTPTLGVQRPDLLRALAALLPAEWLRLGHELVDVRFTGKKVALYFTNRESFLCDGVVGADGIHSRIRTHFLGAAKPSYRGYAIFRGLVDAPSSLALGRNGESWGAGGRFGILAVGQNKVCWYATANAADQQQLKDNRKQRMRQLFRGWHDPIPDLIEATDQEAILLNDACDVRTSRTWSHEPVTLLGDAAHALTPNLGQGACIALDDAFVLAKCLRAGAGVTESFRRYESLRFTTVRSAVLRSRWLGQVGQWESRAAITLRNAVTRLLPGRLFECHSTAAERMASLIGVEQPADWQLAIGK